MKIIQTIPEYYKEINLPQPKIASFHVGRHETNMRTIKRKQSPVKHELYSISITNIDSGSLSINYTNALRLFIISPFKVISWDIIGRTVEGMYIIFDKEFISSNMLWKNFLAKFPYFRYNNLVTENLPDIVLAEIYQYFQKIETAYQENTPDTFEVLKAYVHIVLLLLRKHLCLMPLPAAAGTSFNHKLLADFELALLNAVGNPKINPDFRRPSHYAYRLNIHVNHLNAVIKQMTSKTTSDMIQEHIIEQAGVLLQQPNQTIKTVAAHFRFTASTHFIAFFKKQTGFTPKQYQARHAQ